MFNVRAVSSFAAILAISWASGQNINWPKEDDFGWSHTVWAKPDVYSKIRKTVEDHARLLINKHDDRQLALMASQSFNNWQIKPNNCTRLFVATIWHLESFKASESFADAPTQSARWKAITEGWKTAKDMHSAEFSRAGFVVWGNLQLGVKFCKLGKALYTKFKDDVDFLHVYVMSIYNYGVSGLPDAKISNEDKSVMIEVQGTLEKRLKEKPTDLNSWLSIAHIYRHIALTSDSPQLLTKSRVAIETFIKLCPKKRVTEYDREFLREAQNLERTLPGIWAKRKNKK